MANQIKAMKKLKLYYVSVVRIYIIQHICRVKKEKV